MVISSMDLHESFVEPLDWIDDFDKDIRVRLSRDLKAVDDTSSDSAKNVYVPSDLTKVQESTVSTLGKTCTEISPASAKSPTLEIAFMPPASNIHDLPGRDSVRVRREVDVPYETYYDDISEHQQDSERTDYNRYSKNAEAMDDRLQLLNSYGDVEDVRRRLSRSHTKIKGHDSLEDDDSEGDYKEVVRNARSKKGGKHKKKKEHYRDAYTKKRKSHGGKSKYLGNNHRKRRHHKKHSVSKTKNHEHDEKKHKKHVSKNANHHTSVKKSKATEDQNKLHKDRHGTSVSGRKVPREKMERDDTMNSHDDFHGRRISLLLAGDDMEDESQMDAALHGELAGKIVEQIFEQVLFKYLLLDYNIPYT
ncbi:uncharacterized protein LOC143374910 [Andrena cerasifolii]|uniref:uncharacterized protein LOC143374910 n=1 Tax=Andrena cerasifolii TaxID=2819439 RepID=UPI00403798C8